MLLRHPHCISHLEARQFHTATLVDESSVSIGQASGERMTKSMPLHLFSRLLYLTLDTLH